MTSDPWHGAYRFDGRSTRSDTAPMLYDGLTHVVGGRLRGWLGAWLAADTLGYDDPVVWLSVDGGAKTASRRVAALGEHPGGIHWIRQPVDGWRLRSMGPAYDPDAYGSPGLLVIDEPSAADMGEVVRISRTSQADGWTVVVLTEDNGWVSGLVTGCEWLARQQRKTFDKGGAVTFGALSLVGDHVGDLDRFAWPQGGTSWADLKLTEVGIMTGGKRSATLDITPPTPTRRPVIGGL